MRPLSQNDKNPLERIQDVSMSQAEEDRILHNLRAIMQAEDSLQEPQPTRSFSWRSIQSVMAGVAGVLLVGGVLLSGERANWFQSGQTTTAQTNSVSTNHNNTPIVPSKPKPKNTFEEVHMLNTQFGWAVNYNQIAVTNDGKKTWSFVTPPGLRKDSNAKMAALNTQSAVVAGTVLKGITYQAVDVYVTNDGGKHWTKQTIKPTTGWAYALDIDFVNSKTGWLVIQTKNPPNQSEVVTLYQTHDGGQTWKPISESGSNGLPMTERVSEVSFVTTKIGWTSTLGFSYVNAHIGKAWVYKTKDGGVTWSKVSLPIPSSLNKDYLNADVPVFTSPNNGTCTITYTNNPEMGTIKTMVFQTTDGGKHWTRNN